MDELVHSAQNFMNADDAIIAKKRKKAERMEADPPPSSRTRTSSKEGLDRREGSRQWESKFVFRKESAIHALEQVLMQIKDDPSLKWLEKIKGDPNKCNRNKYCCFHKDHGHDTDEYFDLKQQI